MTSSVHMGNVCRFLIEVQYWNSFISYHTCSGVPRGGRGLGCSNPPLPPEIPKFWQSCIWL